MSSSSSLDCLELCRLCLEKERVSVPIFENEGDVRQIFLKITACLPVKVSRDDKLPKKICDDCLYKVELFYQFWNTTANAEKQLLQWLGEVGGLEDGVPEVLVSNVMKQEQASDSRLEGRVVQVGGQNSVDMGMIENMTIITMPLDGEQQFASVPMDTSGTVTVQAVASSSASANDQSQTSVSHLADEVEDDDDDDDDDGCDNEGMPVKEENEEDQSDRVLDQSSFVTIPCDEAGPSGLQQKIADISNMSLQPTEVNDPKTGLPYRPSQQKILNIQLKKAKTQEKPSLPVAKTLPAKPETDQSSEFEEVSLDGSCTDITPNPAHRERLLYMCRPCNIFFPTRLMVDRHRAQMHPDRRIKQSAKRPPPTDGDRAYFMGYHRVLGSGKYVCNYCPFQSFNRTTVSSHSQRKHVENIKNRTSPKAYIPDEPPDDCTQQLLLFDEVGNDDDVEYMAQASEQEKSSDEQEDDKSDIVRKFLEDTSDDLLRTCPCCPFETTKCSAYRAHMKRAHRDVWIQSLSHKLQRDIKLIRVPQSELETPNDDVVKQEQPDAENEQEEVLDAQSFLLQELIGEDATTIVEGQIVEEIIVGQDGSTQLVVRNKLECPLCPYNSWVQGNLHSHMSRMHPGEPTPKFNEHLKRKKKQPQAPNPKQQRPKNKTPDSSRPKSGQKRRRERSAAACTGYACAYCTFVACTINSLERHSGRNHEGLKVMITEVPVISFDCDMCELKSSDRKDMQNHLKTHKHEMNEEGMYTCTMCSYDTSSRMGLQRHISIKHLRPRAPTMVECYECDLCDYKCLNGQAMAWHRQQHDLPEGEQIPIFICNECNFSTWNKSQLVTHMKRKHKELVEGPDCPYAAGPIVNLRGELVEEFNELGEPVMHCDYCDYITKNKHVLKVHVIRKHTDQWNFECDQCGKKFKVKADLTNHMRFQHKEQPIMCDVCGKQCRNSNLLYLHQKFAHYKPEFECPVCHRRMVSQANLDEHILKQHETTQESVCEECGKTFKKLARLKVHMRVHTGLKPYTCKICLRAFGRRNGLRQHLLIHSGQRVYICDICGKSFVQKTGLISHRKMHPGTLPPLPRVTIDHVLNELLQEEEEFERKELEREFSD